jgi:hypothetical protein
VERRFFRGYRNRSDAILSDGCRWSHGISTSPPAKGRKALTGLDFKIGKTAVPRTGNAMIVKLKGWPLGGGFAGSLLIIKPSTQGFNYWAAVGLLQR